MSTRIYNLTQEQLDEYDQLVLLMMSKNKFISGITKNIQLIDRLMKLYLDIFKIKPCSCGGKELAHNAMNGLKFWAERQKSLNG